MTATIPDPSQTSLAVRLSHEMREAERHGFRTSTVWLTREETDLICAALRAASGADGARLDFLDRCVAAMTARDRAERGWRLSIDGDGLVLGAEPGPPRPVSSAGGHPSCRSAIDERMAELECARAFTAVDDGRHEPNRDATSHVVEARTSSKAP